MVYAQRVTRGMREGRIAGDEGLRVLRPAMKTGCGTRATAYGTQY